MMKKGKHDNNNQSTCCNTDFLSSPSSIPCDIWYASNSIVDPMHSIMTNTQSHTHTHTRINTNAHAEMIDGAQNDCERQIDKHEA